MLSKLSWTEPTSLIGWLCKVIHSNFKDKYVGFYTIILEETDTEYLVTGNSDDEERTINIYKSKHFLTMLYPKQYYTFTPIKQIF